MCRTVWKMSLYWDAASTKRVKFTFWKTVIWEFVQNNWLVFDVYYFLLVGTVVLKYKNVKARHLSESIQRIFGEGGQVLND